MSLDKEYLDITFLKENGFVRKQCPKCGKYFWTTDESREICGDPPCESYSFIERPVFKRPFELDEMRELYLSFFENRGHGRIDRYPVVARWRTDIYLTIASIADFQPFVTSGVAPPPANPLTISQPCIRLDDLDSVGRTGRHLTLFEMMAHHAFNYPEKEIYWKNETVAYCTELLEKLGVSKENIIYKEEPWAGGGNAGPCLEALVGGLELATLVFMNLEEHPDGDIVIKGERYRKMDNYIVDTGYGLERFVWASKGTPTVYDAIFPDVVDKIIDYSNIGFSRRDDDVKRVVAESSKLAGIMGELRGEKLKELRQSVANTVGVSVDELERIVVPLEKVYALADHTRCILFMLGDGLVPSNAGAGYLARLMIRRSFRLAEELELGIDIYDLIEMHRDILKFDFDVSLDTIQEILDIEKQRYSSTVAKGTRLVERLVQRKKRLEKEDLIELYDSHGVPAELAIKIAHEKGAEVEIPKDFYAELAARHSKAEKVQEAQIKLKGKYPKTEKLYYDDPTLFEFSAEVIGVEDDYVILDRSAFYPESGGQDNDVGLLVTNGSKYEVVDVLEVDGVVLHKIKGAKPEKGTKVSGVIDPNVRWRHMRHHSATHVLLYAIQRVLGNHVWQAGARKEFGKARLDVTHFKRPSDEEIKEIEVLANREILANKPVKWTWMNRIEAERKYGFRLYQGGVPPGKDIRIVQVGDDVQACGGTHCRSTGEIGVLKILKVESIQDGVIRFEYAAGEAAIEAVEEIERLLREASAILRVEPAKLPKTVERFFEEWKEQRKEIDRLKAELADVRAESMIEKAEEFDSIKVVADIVEGDMQVLQKLAESLASKGAVGCLMSKREGKVFVVTFSGQKYDARELMREIGRRAKGSGGGRKDVAQGAVQQMLSKDELLDIIFEFLSKHE
ncbi:MULTISPECIES: alanine--tRNA ligase [unclassified Archaeoglobus]|mgnify:CR=1 FL=1|jgi:alanyl-tRNA synthetase|uniref:alanine--tRNA ligase n=1 Tax=unclassified Archaeoglobus TaxID=2643606 RepID=UPI0025C70AF7|nr:MULTISPECIES: alanine--tRNA ligase [unclassified Archaeoglobus]